MVYGQLMYFLSIFRQQVTEIIFVLKAISTLMDSLKKTQPENGKLPDLYMSMQRLYEGKHRKEARVAPYL